MFPKIFFATSVFGFLLTAACANALTVNGTTDVGSIDTLLNSAALGNSSEASEADWINSILGTSYTGSDITKTEYTWPGDTSWISVDSTTNVYAFDLVTDGGYFVLKVGNIGLLDAAGKNVNAKDLETMGFVVPDHFLYANGASEDWAVVAFADVLAMIDSSLDSMGYDEYSAKSFDIDKISHLSEVGDSSTAVPEPATMLLFGTGIAGLAGIARRKRD